MNKKQILVIEDEDLIREALIEDFLIEGYDVDASADGISGLEKAKSPGVDLIILDIMLPEINGFDLCKKLRYEGIDTPIIMLTAKGQEIDRVVGLEVGADDYVTKPFSPRELQARVKAVLRRSEKKAARDSPFFLKFGALQVDFSKYECYKNRQKINLTAHEFELLRYLFENKGRVIDRNELLDKVWGVDVVIGPRTIDTHMANLRRKVEDNVNQPKLIISVRGIGYRIGID